MGGKFFLLLRLKVEAKLILILLILSIFKIKYLKLIFFLNLLVWLTFGAEKILEKMKEVSYTIDLIINLTHIENGY